MMILSDEERGEVEAYIRRGKAKARNMRRAHSLLKRAEGWSIERIAAPFEVSAATVSKVPQSQRHFQRAR